MKMTYSNGIGTSRLGFSAHIRKETRHLVLVHVVQLGGAALAGVEDVFPQKLLRNLAFSLVDIDLSVPPARIRLDIHRVVGGLG